MKRILQNKNVLSLAGNLVASGAGFLSFAILARVLEPAMMGEWLMYLTVITFLELVRSGLIQTALVRFYAGAAEKAYIGSAWIITLTLTLIILILVSIIDLVFPELYSGTNLNFFLSQFWIYFLVTLPQSVASWILQAEGKFSEILILRLGFAIPFLFFNISGFHFHWNALDTSIAQNVIYTILSVLTILLGWSRISSISGLNKKHIREMLHYGKYTMGTTLATNLLKSSDTFILGAVLNPVAIAMYNLPYKLIEVIEIPLRSFAATTFPELSRLHHEGDNEKLKALYQRWTNRLSLFLAPFSLLILIFAEECMVVMGGEEYRESANILRIFCIYSLFLPADRFIGITLDSVGLPKFNTIKVVTMVLVNGIGSFLILKIYPYPLPVAIVTVFTVLVGVGIGFAVLNNWFKENKTKDVAPGIDHFGKL